MGSIILGIIEKHFRGNAVVSQSSHGFVKGRSYLANLISFYKRVSHLVDKWKAVDVWGFIFEWLLTLTFTVSFWTKCPAPRTAWTVALKPLAQSGITSWVTPGDQSLVVFPRAQFQALFSLMFLSVTWTLKLRVFRQVCSVTKLGRAVDSLEHRVVLQRNLDRLEC